VQVTDVENFLINLPRIAPVNVQKSSQATTLTLRSSSL
jgi:hypothetical protein